MLGHISSHFSLGSLQGTVEARKLFLGFLVSVNSWTFRGETDIISSETTNYSVSKI